MKKEGYASVNEEDTEESEGDDDEFFKLMSAVDDISCDVNLSKESRPSALRSVKSATLPALLRRLTTIELTTQSQILTFLLNMKAFHCTPQEVIVFLKKRFFLTEAAVDIYAEKIRTENIQDNICNEQCNFKKCDFDDSTTDNSSCEASKHWLLEDCSLIGCQYYWHCSLQELVKHEGDPIAENMYYIRKKRMARSSSLSSSSNPLQSLCSVQAGVLLFLETWLTHVPEDFLLCESSCQVNSFNCKWTEYNLRRDNQYNKMKNIQSLSQCSDALDHMLDFLSEIVSESSMKAFGLMGGDISEKDMKWQFKLHSHSMFTDHFPCICKLLTVMKNFNELIDKEEALIEGNACIPSTFECHKTESESVGAENSLSLHSDEDRAFYKLQLERVMSGEICSRDELTSLRASFLEKFGNDSLSEILEFESEIMSQGNEHCENCRPDSWNSSPSTALVAAKDTSTGRNTSDGSRGSPDAMDYFKSLFAADTGAIKEKEDSESDQAEDVNKRDSHRISLPIKVKGSYSSVFLFILQQVVPSALLAASIGVRALTTFRRSSLGSDDLCNVPLGSDSTGDPASVQHWMFHEAACRAPVTLKHRVMSTLVENNERSIASSVEIYSYLGLLLSAVEIRTAQDYVASGDMTMATEVPSRLFTDPIDKHIMLYSSTDEQCSAKISYLVKSSREEDLMPLESSRAMTPPSVDKERSQTVRAVRDDSNSIVYDADYNNSSRSSQQVMRQKQLKQRRRTMGSFLKHRESSASVATKRRQTIYSSGRNYLSSKSSGSRQSADELIRQSVGTGGSPSNATLRSTSFSISESLFGNKQVYLGPSIFLDFDVYQVAANLTMRLHYMFCTIPMLEFTVDYAYAYDASHAAQSRTPMLTRFRQESEKLQALFIGEVLVHPDVSTRAEVIVKMIKVAEHLGRIRSHHALMLIVYSLFSQAIYRLKSTWAVVNAKLPGRWDLLTELVGMGGSKLVALYCQRQPKFGISEDLRSSMRCNISVASEDNHKDRREDRHGECADDVQCSQACGHRGSNSDESDLDSTEDRGSSCVVSNSSDVPTGCLNRSENGEREGSRSMNPPSNVMLPITMRVARESDDFGVGFNIMTAHDKKERYSLRRAFVSGVSLSGDGSSDKSSKREHMGSSISSNVERGSEWQVTKVIPVDKFDADSETDNDENDDNDGCVSVSEGGKSNHSLKFSEGDVAVPREDRQSDTSSCIETSETACSSTIHGNGDKSNDMLSSLRQPVPSCEKQCIYRNVMIGKMRSRSASSTGLGEVRSDGLSAHGSFSGLPVEPPKPFMPFLNGVFQKIIRLNELPDFLRANESVKDSDIEQVVGDVLWVTSPGNSCTDHKLMMMNFGKYRAITNLLMLLRSSQLTPFSLHTDFAVQMMLYRNPNYKTEDDIWDRSSELE